MKKATTFLLLSLLILSAKAQGTFKLSFSAGPTINWMNSEMPQVSRGKTTAGFEFGINSDFFLDYEERYAISTGLLVNNTGGELNYNTEFQFAGNTIESGSNINYKLKYLEIPLAIKLNTSQFNRSVYWGQFGISSFINIKAKAESNTSILDQTNISKEINLFNLALNIGAGAEYDLGGNNALVIGLIFKNGITDITTDNDLDEKTSMNSLTLKLGMVF